MQAVLACCFAALLCTIATAAHHPKPLHSTTSDLLTKLSKDIIELEEGFISTSSGSSGNEKDKDGNGRDDLWEPVLIGSSSYNVNKNAIGSLRGGLLEFPGATFQLEDNALITLPTNYLEPLSDGEEGWTAKQAGPFQSWSCYFTETSRDTTIKIRFVSTKTSNIVVVNLKYMGDLVSQGLKLEFKDVHVNHEADGTYVIDLKGVSAEVVHGSLAGEEDSIRETARSNLQLKWDYTKPEKVSFFSPRI